tara:strand:- start:88 stop:495 length:408 start_codon:yes stop_codon:yes gene_type:complete
MLIVLEPMAIVLPAGKTGPMFVAAATVVVVKRTLGHLTHHRNVIVPGICQPDPTAMWMAIARQVETTLPVVTVPAAIIWRATPIAMLAMASESVTDWVISLLEPRAKTMMTVKGSGMTMGYAGILFAIRYRMRIG